MTEAHFKKVRAFMKSILTHEMIDFDEVSRGCNLFQSEKEFLIFFDIY